MTFTCAACRREIDDGVPPEDAAAADAIAIAELRRWHPEVEIAETVMVCDACYEMFRARFHPIDPPPGGKRVH